MARAKTHTPEAGALRAAQRAAYAAMDPVAKARRNAHVRHMRAAGRWSNPRYGAYERRPATRPCGECGAAFEHGGTARRYCPECRAKWADLAEVKAETDTRPRCAVCTCLLRPERGEPDESGRCAACSGWERRRARRSA